MTIKDELTAELRGAIKSGDKTRAAAVRQVETGVSLARSEPGFAGEVDDDLYRSVIASYVKRITKAKEEYDGYGERGREPAQRLAAEIEFLERWLPRTLDEAETGRIVDDAIAALGATDAAQAGRVIGHVMKSGREGLDGALVNRLVRERLGAG